MRERGVTRSGSCHPCRLEGRRGTNVGKEKMLGEKKRAVDEVCEHIMATWTANHVTIQRSACEGLVNQDHLPITLVRYRQAITFLMEKISKCSLHLCYDWVTLWTCPNLTAQLTRSPTSMVPTHCSKRVIFLILYFPLWEAILLAILNRCTTKFRKITTRFQLSGIWSSTFHKLSAFQILNYQNFEKFKLLSHLNFQNF